MKKSILETRPKLSMQTAIEDFEPRRVCRRLISLSYAAMSSASRAAYKLASSFAGGMFLIALLR